MSTATKTVGWEAIPQEGGVSFRVWAPNAEAVSVIGDFNDWDSDAHEMELGEGGWWFIDTTDATNDLWRDEAAGPDRSVGSVSRQ